MKPWRVVLFCGQVPDPGACVLLEALDRDPRVQVAGAFAQSTGFALGERIRDLWHRRRWLALPLLLVEGLDAALALLSSPLDGFRNRKRMRRLHKRFAVVLDLHSADVIEAIRRIGPDLGLVYGAPILRPELFRIPRWGSLGIHHGKVPQYRGKKTTFWAMFNGERSVGVTIQRLNEGIDTGEIVFEGEVEVRGKSYRTVSRELDALGVHLFHRAVIDVLEGRAVFVPQNGPRGRLYRDPKPADLLRFWWRRLGGSLRIGPAPPPLGRPGETTAV